jgi:hypothetical protein
LRWWLVITLIVAIGTANQWARPVYRHIKQQRGQRMAPEIQRLLGEGSVRFPEVGQKLRLALALAPEDPTLLRLAGQYSLRARVESGLNYYQMLTDGGNATRQDRLDHATMAIALNRLEVAFAQVKALLEEDPDDREALALRIRIFERKEDQPRALAAAMEALRRHSLDESLQLVTGRLLILATNDARQTQGRRLLWGLSVGDGPLRDPAVELLAGVTNLSVAEDRSLLKELRRRTNASLSDRLNAAKVQLRLDPDQRGPILESLVAQFRTGADTNQLGQLATWLLTLEEPEMLLRTVSSDVAQLNGHLLSCRLEALAALRRWEELQPLLEAPPSVLDPVHLHCLRALLAAKGERPSNPDPHFELALTAAENNAARLWLVARSAEQAGRSAMAIEAWKRVIYNPVFALQAAREILRLAQPLDDLRLVRDTLARVAELVPSDEPLAAQLAYLNLVLDEHLDASRTTIERLRTSHPQEPRYRVLLALVELRAHRPAAALAVLEREPVDWDAADDRLRAIYVAVLAANSHAEAARQMARRIDERKLRSSEREFIRPWL